MVCKNSQNLITIRRGMRQSGKHGSEVRWPVMHQWWAPLLIMYLLISQPGLNCSREMTSADAVTGVNRTHRQHYDVWSYCYTSIYYLEICHASFGHYNAKNSDQLPLDDQTTNRHQQTRFWYLHRRKETEIKASTVPCSIKHKRLFKNWTTQSSLIVKENPTVSQINP